MENYENIHYLDYPHFTVGHVDQWGERGYLLYDGKVYWYEEDRKEQWSTTRSPVSIKEFLAVAEKTQLSIPEDFLRKLKETEIYRGNLPADRRDR